MKSFALVLLALVGCTRELQQPPMLVADDSQAVFDTVENAPGSERVFTFTNTGTQPTAPLALQLTGDVDAFHIVGDECSGAVLKPNLRCSVNVQLRSDQPGSFQGELHVAGAFVAASVVLLGKVTPAQLVLTPVTTTDTEVQQGGKVALELTVANAGGATTGALRVMSQSLPFDVGGDCDLAPLVGGASCTIKLTKTVSHLAAIGRSSGVLEVIAAPGGDETLTTSLNITPSGSLYAEDATWTGIPTLTPVVRTVTVSNAQLTNSGPITIALVDPTASSAFTIKTDNCSNHSLGAGQSCTVDLGVVLDDVGVRTAKLTASAASLKPAVATLSVTGVRAHWALIVKITGNGTGRVMEGMNVIQSGSTFLVPNGHAMSWQLTAVADNGSTFAGWNGPPPCIGTGACTGIAGADNSDLELTAAFTR